MKKMDVAVRFRDGQLYVNMIESLDQTGNFLEKYSSHWFKTV